MLLPATESDIPVIVQLMNRAYRGSGGSSGWTTEQAYIAGDRTSEALLRAELRAKPSAFLLKWTDHPTDKIVGCVWLEPMAGDTWYLGSLTIEPERQSGGLGRTLLASAEDWVRERGGKRVRMTVVNVRDTLIAWYGRRCYSETGATESFPYGDDRFGTPLRDDLHFVVLEKLL